MRVLVDCDGVLSDFVLSFIAIINDVLDAEYTAEMVTQFDVAASLGLSPEEKKRVELALSTEPRFAYHLRPYPGTRHALAALDKIADVRIVTSPWDSHATWEYDRKKWLRKHFGIHHSHVTHTSEKWAVIGDVFIDDKVQHVEKWAAQHPKGLAVHWRTPHNRREETLERSTSSWEELLRWVQERAA